MRQLSYGELVEQFYEKEGKLYRKNLDRLPGVVMNTGYRVVSIKDVKYLAHRLLYMIYHKLDYSSLPKIIDHKDGDITNNSKDNLRGCESNVPNIYNCKPQKGKSKFKGVSHNGFSWTAQIMINRKSVYLGSFKTEEEAAKAYDLKAVEAFGEFAWVNFKNEIGQRIGLHGE